MALTLEDIAQLSDCSRSTVSRVINGDKNVREETRLKVLEIIQEHHFQPNIAARRLAAGRTNIIGLVIPTGVGNILSDPYFSSLIQAVTRECNAREYSVMLWLTEPEYERRTIGQIIGNGMPDGVVISSTLIDDPVVSALYVSNLPFVMIGHHPTYNINSVDIDNSQAAHQISKHLFTCRPACQRPASITGPQNTIIGRERYIGFLSALKEVGLNCDPDLIVESDFSEAGGYFAMQKLLSFKPDAVFAASDSMAAGAIKAAHEAGLTIPQDFSLVGFGDDPLARLLEPALTTIRQPIQNMGVQAVDMLIQTMRHPETQTRQIILPAEIIIRLSCGGYHP